MACSNLDRVLHATQLLEEGARLNQARTLAEAAAEGRERDGGWESLIVRAAELALREGDVPGAEVLLETAAEASDVPSLKLTLARARLFSSLGQHEEAAKLLLEAQKGHQHDVELGFRLAEILLTAGRPAAARDALEQIKPFVGLSDRMRLLRLEGAAFEREGRYYQAIGIYQTAARLQPRNVGLHFELARLYEQQGRFGEAIDALREGRRHQPPEELPKTDPWVQRLTEAAKRRDPGELPTLGAPDPGTE